MCLSGFFYTGHFKNSFLFVLFLFEAAVAWQCSNCVVQYKAVGCFKDSPSRVLKEHVLNERDPRSKVFKGIRIDWFNWNNYMPAFACRCAQIVKDKGYTVFGLQFYGRFWHTCQHPGWGTGALIRRDRLRGTKTVRREPPSFIYDSLLRVQFSNSH